MPGFNIFRILGDISHALSKCILIFAIHRNRSAEGVSLITQILYAAVFCARYLDLFRNQIAWNFCFKIFYITSSFYTIGIMRWIYPRTREKELAWKMGALCLAGSLLLSPFVMLIFEYHEVWSFMIWLWDLSQILESVCVLPQLLLLRQTTVPTVIDSMYLVTLGSYRGFYILNWIWRELDTSDRPPNPVSVIFGIVQTALYVDFAWVYWTRQRVKLRDGGIVDADDMRRGWLLRRIFGARGTQPGDDDGLGADGEEDEESAPALGRRAPGAGRGGARGGGRGGFGNGAGANGNGSGSKAADKKPSRWGARGISVSADEGVLAADAAMGAHEEGVLGGDDEATSGAGVDPDARMKDPDELARALVEDYDEDDDPLPAAAALSGVENGNEWRDH